MRKKKTFFGLRQETCRNIGEHILGIEWEAALVDKIPECWFRGTSCSRTDFNNAEGRARIREKTDKVAVAEAVLVVDLGQDVVLHQYV